MTLPSYYSVPHGFLEGCSKMNWGAQWGWALFILLGIYSCLVPTVVALTYKGYNMLGMALYPAGFILVSIFIAPWCGLDAKLKGSTIQMISNIIIVGLVYVCAILNYNKEKFMKKDGFLGYLMNKKIGKPAKGWGQTDFVILGPINEFLTMSYMELIGFAVVLAWVAICVWARYRDLMDEDIGIEHAVGNKARAFGRAMSAASLRFLLLSMVSPSRNTIVIWFMGIPFERALKWHKIFGRLQVLVMYIHMIAMLIGGTEKGVDIRTNSDGTYKEDDLSGFPDYSQVKWNDRFVLWGSGSNLACGPIALFFWTALLLSSQPYFRRKMMETFYFLHINFFFIANVMTIFHARATVVPWTAASILLFYIDLPIRIISKLSGVEAVEIDVIGDNITKLVLKQEGFPKKAFSFHAGSYIWLSCNLRKSASKIGNTATVAVTSETVTSTTSTVTATEVELTNTGKAGYDKAAKSDEESIMDDKMLSEIFSNVKVPGGPPSGLPSWLWFHPITISSYNKDTNEMTLYIKAFGEGNTEWSGQLLSAAKLVKNGTLNKEDIGFHIGGPNGSLMIKDHLESLDHVIMISGGIGVTPFIAVLEDLIMKKFQGKITFYWSTRSVAEIDAFKKYYELCSGNDKFEVNVFYTNKSSNAESGLTADNKGYKIISGKRPDFNDIKVVKGESIGVMSCGPDDLMIAAESFAFDKQKEGHSIIFHKETFEF